MNSYKYKAVDSKGRCVKGIYDCDSEIALGKALKLEGYYVTKYSLHKSKRILKLSKIKLNFKETSVLCRNISSLLGTGINIIEVLDILEKQSENVMLKNILYRLEIEVRKGNSFYESIKKYDYFFPKFMIEMIAVGEKSGSLQTILINLSEYFETIDVQGKKIKKAMTYPTVVFILTIVICTFIITNIIPMFALTLSTLKGKIPRSTQKMIDMSMFFKSNQLRLLLLNVVLIFSICFYFQSLKGNKFKQRIKFRIPFLGRLFKKIWEMRFSYSMGIMIDKGLNVAMAMEIIETTADEYVKAPINKSIKEIQEGSNLFQALKNIEFLSPTLISLIQIGEKTGELDNMFFKASQIIEEDINSLLEKLISYIEPIMISIISVIVGMLIYLFMMPILNIMDSL